MPAIDQLLEFLVSLPPARSHSARGSSLRSHARQCWASDASLCYDLGCDNKDLQELSKIAMDRLGVRICIAFFPKSSGGRDASTHHYSIADEHWPRAQQLGQQYWTRMGY